LRAENRGRRNPLSPRAESRKEKDKEHEETTLDFILNILSLSPRQSSREAGVKGNSNHMFDYNFSLLQTVIMIILIGIMALGGLVLVLALLT